MNKFQILLTEHAIDDLKKIFKDLRDQIHQDLRILESAPFPSGTHIKRLKGFRPTVYRLRSGNFRIALFLNCQGGNRISSKHHFYAAFAMVKTWSSGCLFLSKRRLRANSFLASLRARISLSVPLCLCSGVTYPIAPWYLSVL